jgi:hypothetical protein
VTDARVAEGFHELDGNRPRPDSLNALGYSFGQAHAGLRESTPWLCHGLRSRIAQVRGPHSHVMKTSYCHRLNVFCYKYYHKKYVYATLETNMTFLNVQ